ncbi:MAG TPA: hydrogenase 4 subunit B, partial [Mycobacteriales bacterium]|nr:hydrogenase 4 subunit B [Mycobacteriales bacterium]
GVAAIACVVLALAPTFLVPRLAPVVAIVSTTAATHGALTLRLSGVAGSLSPLELVAALLAGVVVVWGALRLAVRGRTVRRARLWDCGAGPLSARMEYTATSFAEPLQRVFDDVVRPEQDVDVTHHEESAYLVRAVEYRRLVPDRIERRLYEPVLSGVRAWGRIGRQLATGSVHRYLGYGFYAVTGLLILLAVTR